MRPDAGRIGIGLAALLIAALLQSCHAGPEVDATGTAVPDASGLVITPRLVGLGVQDAKRILLADDLELDISREYSRKAKGSVLRQLPAPGEEIGSGLTVIVVVAKPIPRVPDVSFEGVQVARAKLKARGFRVRVKDSHSFLTEAFDRGTVLDYGPSGRALPGRLITLRVATGPQSTVEDPPPGCHDSYSEGCVPIAADVDCGGGGGNGPAYVWETVRVVGPDVYDLDGNDNDGWGCE